MELPKLLLVEDDRLIASTLSQAIKTCYEVQIASSGKLALYIVEADQFDLILLDLNLPDIDGLTVCQTMRERGYNSPIIILSGEANTLTKINLLDAGANDYMTKPFSLGELKARLRAAARSNPSPSKVDSKLSVGDLTLDRLNYSVYRGDVYISLRRKEFALLECLMEHKGLVVTRDTLTRYVWPGTGTLWTNTVDVHIKHLRDKVDRPFDESYIKTVHGLGYKIEVTSPAALISE